MQSGDRSESWCSACHHRMFPKNLPSASVMTQHQGEHDAFFSLTQIEMTSGCHIADAVVNLSMVEADGRVQRRCVVV